MSDSNLEQFAVVRFSEDELLLVERVECASSTRSLLLLHTLLATQQVDLHVRGCTHTHVMRIVWSISMVSCYLIHT